MSDGAGPLARLRADLQRPAGGWTVGFATLFGAMLAPLTATVIHPALWFVGFALFIAHIGWGLHGYYPRGY